MYKKYQVYDFFLYIRQECESSLKHKTEVLKKLESQKEYMATTIATLEQK